MSHPQKLGDWDSAPLVWDVYDLFQTRPFPAPITAPNLFGIGQAALTYVGVPNFIGTLGPAPFWDGVVADPY